MVVIGLSTKLVNVKHISHAITYIHTNLISGYSSCMVAKAIWQILLLHEIKTQLRDQKLECINYTMPSVAPLKVWHLHTRS